MKHKIRFFLPCVLCLALLTVPAKTGTTGLLYPNKKHINRKITFSDVASPKSDIFWEESFFHISYHGTLKLYKITRTDTATTACYRGWIFMEDSAPIMPRSHTDTAARSFPPVSSAFLPDIF